MEDNQLGKYNPKDFEEEIYKNWNEKGYFGAKVDKTKTPYTIVIPPPNITGRLHMGHALDNTLQDILIRYKRMQGFNALWIPGTDHASIATEAKIVEKLKAEGTTKEALGREKFLERAWEWKIEYGGEIISQLKKLGCSCDWSRERFTLDEGLSEAVIRVFINLYNKGLIYKGNKMINWCPYCKTTISDAEVEFEEEKSNLWHIKYKRTDNDGYVVVATTRPETMLGDTAVAVNPEDERYLSLIGKTVIIPIINKEIPVIADSFVDKSFGTGAVKITPAHDVNDYEVGLKHNLDIIEVFSDAGIMLGLAKEFEGLDIIEARKRIVERLKELDALEKTEDYVHNVGKCYRCHNTIEPRISNQWFVRMKPLAEPAIEAVKTNKIKFVPENFNKTYFNWMENIQDWCISRQLWWGHRIPAFYCTNCGETYVSEVAPKKCNKCDSSDFTQDEGTLDTWFSSALWPFSTLGWPRETEDFKYFYPTNTLVTGYDIIFFWVARMIFSGIEYTGKIPFNTVLIHGIVRDSKGIKMSKSLGNGIDPLEVIDKYGTDALRFSLLLNTTIGNDLRYSTERLEQASNFANKIWNATKFVLMNLTLRTDMYENVRGGVLDDPNIHDNTQFDPTNLSIEDKWILNALNKLIKEVTNNLDNYDFGIALQNIYSFIWNEFCDWYIEMVKPRLYNKDCDTRLEAEYTLNYVLTTCLKLLHPYMPFLTEKLYMQLIHSDESIMISDWPKHTEMNYDKEEKNIELIKQIIIGIRNVRANMNIHPSKKSKIIFVTTSEKESIEAGKSFLEKLGFASEIVIQENKNGIQENAISIAVPKIEIFIPLEDLIDKEAEILRLNKEKEKVLIELKKAEDILSNSGFVQKAPPLKVQEMKDNKLKYEEILKTIEERLKLFI
ncbi:MAG: valine--tRNA ligase [Oscillospiraceae bacterium]|nr:valine--tRNA ligase [Oscillospiraceae bacterium]